MRIKSRVSVTAQHPSNLNDKSRLDENKSKTVYILMSKQLPSARIPAHCLASVTHINFVGINIFLWHVPTIDYITEKKG